MKFSSLPVISSISCAAFVQIRGVRSLSTTINSTKYFFLVFGLRKMIRADLIGFTCEEGSSGMSEIP